jgi:hypothetical protein
VLGVCPAHLVFGWELGNSCSNSSFSRFSLNSFLCEFVGPSRPLSFWFQVEIDSGGISPGQPWGIVWEAPTILEISQGRDSFNDNTEQRNFTYYKAFLGPLPFRWQVFTGLCGVSTSRITVSFLSTVQGLSCSSWIHPGVI